jgi:protoheme IX farnesyltransferase
MWYGAGLLYGLGAGTGGAFFLWKSIALYFRPTKKTAMSNFLASLLQLSLLILGVLLNAAFAL